MNTAGARITPLGPDSLQAILTLQGQCPEVHAWSAANWTTMLHESVARGPVLQCVLGALHAPEGLVAVVAGSMLGDHAELEILITHPGFRRRGVGRELADAWLAWAVKNGARQVTLEVRLSNAGAQQLYRALGFAEVARRGGYYVQPVEDALVMQRPLGPVPGRVRDGSDATV